MREDTYVSAADLTASRPPPYKRTGLSDLIRNPNFIRIIAVIYIALFFTVQVQYTSEVTIVEDDTTSTTTTAVTRSVASFIAHQLQQIWSDIGNFTEGFVIAALIGIPFVIFVFWRGLNDQNKHGIPFYRNVIFIRDFTQVIFLILIIGGIYGLNQNLQENFQDSGLIVNFNVLSRNYSVAITEGPDYNEPIEWVEDIPLIGDSLSAYTAASTNTRALMTGLSNTLRAVIVALVITTILGVFLGIGLLSNNWLVRIVSSSYVEVFRNTPLLVQLFFVYSSIRLLLPTQPQDAIEFPGFIYVSARGVNYPKILTQDGFTLFISFAVVGFIGGVYLWRRRLKLMDQTGQPAYTLRYFLGSFLGLSAIGLLLATIINGFPLEAQEPILGRFNFERGVGALFTAEFVGLVVALVLYTAAFIADIVRAGIQSVPYGQIEAARAGGLSNNQTLQMIVLPQAMRLIIPPLTNQYLNLAKNSSLAIAIGYYDLFNVGTIAANQSGQVVVFFVVMLLTYLTISLIISAIMNFINQRLQLKER
ncbi:MAG: ABC transporter permease subunit [Chloroflexi bacterium]|nr:ABC transporter permease subunit [Chloroflexota bacterium]